MTDPSEHSAPWAESVLADLLEWIRIPSISASADHVQDVRAAGEWLAAYLRRLTPDVEILEREGHAPLVIGRVPASAAFPDAPTFLCYGHYDVQPAGGTWTYAPFDAVVDGEWILGRGSSDDKGQFITLLKGAELLIEQGALPVNLLFIGDGEEETLGSFSSDWLREQRQRFDGAIIFDSSFLDMHTPVINISTRGLVAFTITCRTGVNDLHSGLAGGAGMNAFHELVKLLHDILATDGELAKDFSAGAIAPSEQELQQWAALPSGHDLLTAQGGRPADSAAAAEYYLRTWARPSLDIHGFFGGSPTEHKTIVVSEAGVNASIRLAPGQQAATVIAALESRLESARISGGDFELTIASTTPASFVSPDGPLISAGVDAFREVWARETAVLRAGGTLPFVATLGDLEIPFLLTGFHVPEGNAHGPDEKFPLPHLFKGVRFVMSLLRRLEGVAASVGAAASPSSTGQEGEQS
jgi:acetylornithine deacetylase/succinyl-diaminopimelate desuccinylase-like protein